MNLSPVSSPFRRSMAMALGWIVFGPSPLLAAERPIVTYWLDSSVDTSTSTGQQIANSMAAAVENYNRYAVFPGPANGSSFPMRVYYSSSVPTAQASGNGSITFGGQRNTRVAQHEFGHVFGAGQHWQWWNLMVGGTWQGDYTRAVLRYLDGPNAGLWGDSMHFWPYGLNQDSEWSTSNARKNVIVTAALMRDMGIGYTWPPVNGPANGTYRLTPAHAPGMALRTTGTASGSAMDIAAYGGGTDQQFRLERQPDGTYEIKSAQAGNRNLSVPGATTSVGAVLQMTNDNNTDAQRWILEPHGTGFRITSHNHLLRVLEAASAGVTDGTPAQSGAYTGTTGSHQLWNLTVIPGTDSQTIAYWNGDVSGLWNSPVSGNTNWATGYNRITDLGRIPDSLTTVFIGAGTANRNTTLGQNFAIPGLIFDGPNPASIGGSHNLTLGGDGIAIGLIAGAATIDTSGQVILGADQIWTNHSLHPLTVASQITGAAKLTVAGVGTVTITGESTYSGGTEIAGGMLQIGNGGTTGSIQGNLINNGGRLTFNRSSNVNYGGGISGNGGLRKIGAGILTLTGTNTYSGGTDINGGAIAVSTANSLGSGGVAPAGGRLQVSGDITLTNSFWPGGRSNSPSNSPDTCAFENLSGNNTISGGVNFASVGGSHVNILSAAGSLTFNGGVSVVNVTGNRFFHFTGAGDIAARGVISNGTATVKVVKGGAGMLTLSGANSYTGGTDMNSGTLRVGNNTALGSGTLTLNGGTLGGTGGFQPTLANAIHVTGATAIASPSGSSLRLNGAISGPGALATSAIFNGNQVVLAGNNSGYSGTITVTGVNTRLVAGQAGSAAATWVVNGALQVNATAGSNTYDLGALSGSGNINSAVTNGSHTLSVGALNTDTTFSGTIQNNSENNTTTGNGPGTNNVLALTKVGSGTLTLSGTNSYTGPTTISGGTLAIDGALAGNGTVSVGGGATLAGSGTIGGAVTVAGGGSLSPGNAGGAGVFQLSGGLALNDGSLLNIGLGADGTSGQVALGGSLAASGTTTVNITALDGFDAGTYPLITSTAAVSAANFQLGTTPAGYGYTLSAAGGTLSLTVVAPAAPPTGLTASGGTSAVTLSWTASFGATSYSIKRSTSPGGGYETVATGVTTTNYTESGVSGETIYYYVVSAANLAGESDHSNEASATTLAAFTPGETWRQQNFGADWDNDEVAGDDADPDGDGVPNLLERAFGGNPNVADQSVLPSIDPEAPLLSIIYRKAKDAADLLIVVEESADLSSADWSAATGAETLLSDDGTVETIRFTAPASSATKKFLRVRVNALDSD